MAARYLFDPNARDPRTVTPGEAMAPQSEAAAMAFSVGWPFGVAAGLYAGSKVPTKGGLTVTDRLAAGIRTAEDISPGRILKTFRMGEFVSAFESSKALGDVATFGPDLFKVREGASPIESARVAFRKQYFSDLAKAGGGSFSFDEAISFRKGALYQGERKVVGNISAMRQRGGEFTLPEFMGRVRGATDGPALLTNKNPFADLKLVPFSTTDRELIKPSLKGAGMRAQAKLLIEQAGYQTEKVLRTVGVSGKTRYAVDFARASAASLVGRLNKLLQAPFESVPVLSSALGKLPFRLDVSRGTAGQMLGGYVQKSAIALAAVGGASYLSHLRGQDDPLSRIASTAGLVGGLGYLGHRMSPFAGAFETKFLGSAISKGGLVGAAIGATIAAAPLFDQGVFEGFGELFAGASLARANIAEATGVNLAAEAVEETFPLSTDPMLWASIPLTAGLIGGIGGYFADIGKTAAAGPIGDLSGRLAARAEAIEDTARAAQQTMKGIGETRGFGRIARMTKQAYRAGGPGTKAAMIVGAAVALPLLASLLPSEDPEELAKIYSGEKLVPIRKGRFWEAGRCNSKNSLILTDYNTFVKASSITMEDTLLGADGRTHSILGIYQRHHFGSILKFKTLLDRNITTELTGNHIVPILKEMTPAGQHIDKDERPIIEVEASTICVGDFVQVPISQLDTSLESINSADILRDKCLFVDNYSHIFPAQTNWYSKKIQKCRGNPIPKIITLDADLGRLMGYFLAEGNLSYGKTGAPHFIETAFAVSEDWIVEDIKQICRSKFDIEPTVRHKMTGPKTKEGCLIVRICSSLLARVFFELFYKGSRDNDKCFPELFFETSQEFKDQLIEGYWRGDGYLDRGRKVIGSARKHLLDAIKILLLNKGICPTMPNGCVMPHIKKNGENCVSFHIGWDGNDVQYGNIQGFQWVEDKLFARIISVEEEEYSDIVYDFEIDHEDHLIVNGTFLVHNSPYEGEQIDRYRQHWIPRLQNHAKDMALYGERGGAFKYSPIFNPLGYIADPYAEEKALAARGYRFPITGTFGEDIPFIGPLVAATLGQLIKPAKSMIPLEEEFAYQSSKAELEPGMVEGYDPIGPAAPISPYSAEAVFSDMSYRMYEMQGLTGFLGSTMKESATGSKEFYTDSPRLESASMLTGNTKAFWDLDIGGGLLTSETYRRLYPRQRREIDLYNPMATDLPSWLPREDYFLNFGEASIFNKIKEPWARLPGEGLASTYPELQGVDPEEYPMIYRHRVLSDVAMYSGQYSNIARQARRALNKGELNERDSAFVEETFRQVQEKRKRREFKDIDGAWGSFVHALETPFEALTPLAPVSKLVHARTAAQEYQRTMLYGPAMARWEHPYENFVKPFFYQSANLAGADFVPEKLQRQRAINEYFDKLKYVKYTRLAQQADSEGNAARYRAQANKTIEGTTGFGNFYQALAALPRKERDFFKEFSTADTPEAQAQILKMVPRNIGALYQNLWVQNEITNLRHSKGLDPSLVDTRLDQLLEYRRKALDQNAKDAELQEYFADATLPPANHVIFNPAVDLEDVKMRYVMNEGFDFHDFDLWNDRRKMLMRKPWVDDALDALAEVDDLPSTMTPNEMHGEFMRSAHAGGMTAVNFSMHPMLSQGGENRVNMNVEDIRKTELNSYMFQQLYDPDRSQFKSIY